MNANANEVIALIGRPSDAARFFQVKPPSVAEWIEKGVIPEGRLIRYAARLEVKSQGRFSRADAFPHDFDLIWPELASVPPAQIPSAIKCANPDIFFKNQPLPELPTPSTHPAPDSALEQQGV